METSFLVSYMVLWIVVVLQGFILLGLVVLVHRLQTNGHASSRVSPPPLRPGAAVPEFATVDLEGNRLSSKDLVGRLTAFLFVAPTCPSCMTTLEEVAGLSHKARGNVVLVCRAGRPECVRLSRTYGSARTIADEDGHW